MSLVTTVITRLKAGYEEKNELGMCFAMFCILHKPSHHHTDRYFCMLESTQPRKGTNAPPVKYPDIPLSVAPVPHNATGLLEPQLPPKDQPCLTEINSDDFDKSNLHHYHHHHQLCLFYVGREIKGVPITLIMKTSMTPFER